MSWRVVEMEVAFLDAFAVDALWIGQTEKPLFQVAAVASQLMYSSYRKAPHSLFLVPEGEGNVQPSMSV